MAFRIFPILAGLLIVAPAVSGGVEPVRGVYSLIKGNKPVSAVDFESNDIAGIVTRSNWKTLEPGPDRYEWSYFDQSVSEAGRAGKKVMLGVFPGIMTPGWVYEQGARPFTFKNPNPRAEGREDAIPLPWDEIFLKEWTDFISEFGKRYNGNSSIVMVTMSGGATNSIEMHLPKGPEAGRAFIDSGYTKDKLVDSWKRVIDAYAEAFPDKSLALPMAVPVTRDGALEEIVEYAVEKVGDRLYLASGALSDGMREDSHLLALARQYADRAGIGFQMLSPTAPVRSRDGSERGFRKHSEGKRRGDSKRRGESGRHRSSEPVQDLRRAFEIGLNAGASYFQVYETDVANPAFRDDIRFAAERLRNSR